MTPHGDGRIGAEDFRVANDMALHRRIEFAARSRRPRGKAWCRERRRGKNSDACRWAARDRRNARCRSCFFPAPRPAAAFLARMTPCRAGDSTPANGSINPSGASGSSTIRTSDLALGGTLPMRNCRRNFCPLYANSLGIGWPWRKSWRRDGHVFSGSDCEPNRPRQQENAPQPRHANPPRMHDA